MEAIAQLVFYTGCEVTLLSDNTSSYSNSIQPYSRNYELKNIINDFVFWYFYFFIRSMWNILPAMTYTVCCLCYELPGSLRLPA